MRKTGLYERLPGKSGEVTNYSPHCVMESLGSGFVLLLGLSSDLVDAGVQTKRYIDSELHSLIYAMHGITESCS